MSSIRSGDRDVVAEPGSPTETTGRVAALVFAALLVLPVKDLLKSHPSPIKLALVLAALAAFLAIYVLRLALAPVADVPSWSTWAWIGIALTITVALVAGDAPQRWATLFIFVAAVIGLRIEPPWALIGVVACTAAAAAALLPTAPLDNAVGVSLEALALGLLMSGMRRLRRVIRELQEAREQLARLAVTEERLRFARDLHDLLGHSLSLIALKAELAGKLLPDQPGRAAREVTDIDAVARRALAEAREAVSGYRQPSLAQAVETGRMALDAAGIEGVWDIAQVALPDSVDVVLGWAVREAVTNVVRHSRARRCWVRVQVGLAEASAEVLDDGVGRRNGSEPGAAVEAPAALADWAGNGLSGLAERVGAIGGRLEAATRAEGGFRLRAAVPTPAALAPVPR